MNIKDAKTIPLAQILEIIGCKPVSTRKGEVIYSSPLRNEKTPSFYANANKNTWYDFGEGRGGNALDFVCAYLASHKEANTVHDALRWLSNMTAHKPGKVFKAPSSVTQKDPSLKVKHTTSVKHRSLINYLEKRGITQSIATKYLSELTIYNSESRKHFFALGVRNEEGGYEIRNPFFKGCVGTKTISFIRGGRPKPSGIHLFEGMFDFLSALIIKNITQLNDDAIILNSLSCLKQATPYIVSYGYQTAYTWLDNDKAGMKATLALQAFFKAEEGLQHQPMNELYRPHKDVNAWHIHKLASSSQVPS